MTEKAVQAEKKNATRIGKIRVGTVGTRGRVFTGTVTKIFGMRGVIEFERIVRIQKYERFAKKKTRLHARIPEGINVKVGDSVNVRECRPLSKLIHFIVTEIVKPVSVGERK
jgi:small subunit ribosomal protein S17